MFGVVAGLTIKPFVKEVSKVVGLKLKAAEPFTWTEKTKPAHAKEYLAYIERHIKGAFYDREYQMYDAGRHQDFLTAAGILGCLTACIFHSSALMEEVV